MFRKGLAVAVILLFIGVAFIPNVSAYDKEINDNTTEPLDVGRSAIRGFGLFPHYHGDNFTFFALRCHYIIITGTSRTTGTIHFRWISTSMPFVHYKEGLLGILIYVFGTRLDDDFEPPYSIMKINNQMII